MTSFYIHFLIFSNPRISFFPSGDVIRMSLHPNWLSISSATDVMEYKVDLTTARSEDKADQYSSIVIMTGAGYYSTTQHNRNKTGKV